MIDCTVSIQRGQTMFFMCKTADTWNYFYSKVTTSQKEQFKIKIDLSFNNNEFHKKTLI